MPERLPQLRRDLRDVNAEIGQVSAAIAALRPGFDDAELLRLDALHRSLTRQHVALCLSINACLNPQPHEQ